MRRTRLAVCLCVAALLFLAVPADAAVIWASSASIVSNTNGQITALGSALGAPDTNAASIGRNPGSQPADITVVLRFGFTGLTDPGGATFFLLVLDQLTVAGTATAQITHYGSSPTAVSSSSAVSLTSAGGFKLPVTTGLAGGATLSSIDVTFSISDGGWPAVVINAIASPEPGSIVLFGLGLVTMGTAGWRVRRKRRRA